MIDFLYDHGFWRFKWFRRLLGGAWICWYPGGRWRQTASLVANYAKNHPKEYPCARVEQYYR